MTSHHVAKLAGVSQSSVSRAFRADGLVTEAIRSRVMSAAHDLGYRPHVAARSLITGRSRLIGVVFAYQDARYYSTMMSELSRCVAPRGYHILTFMAPERAAELGQLIQSILDHRVDGLVIGSIRLSSDLTARCVAAGIPVVLFNRTQEGARFSSVTSDNVAGGRLVAKHLLGSGHRRIAYLAGSEDASTNCDRELGFTSELAARGCPLYTRACADYDPVRAGEVALDMLRDPRTRPEAMFVASDDMAIQVMEVARHTLGLRIPADLSIVGYDDILEASWPSFALTTVRQPISAMVDQTIRIITGSVAKGEVITKHVVLRSRLVIRDSSRL